jgi:hypothetical protein
VREGRVPFPQVRERERERAEEHATLREGERRGREVEGGRQQGLQQRPEALEAAVVTKWHQ